MTKYAFNEGDRVRCLTVCGGETVAVVGGLYTVVCAPQYNSDLLRFRDAAGRISSMFSERFEPAPEVTTPAAQKAPAKAGNDVTPYKPKPGSRLDQVLTHLLSGKSLTQGEGIVLGYGTRVAASVHALRDRGHNIVTTMKEDLKGFPYAEYRLVTRRANGNRKAT